MTDPLADPRAIDLLSADVDDVASLAGLFRTEATESQQTAVGLRAAQHDGVWTGRAAEAFRRAIGRLPIRLDKVRAGFHDVADALYAYEGELNRTKPAFVHVIAELEDLKSNLGPARSAAQGADTALRAAARNPNASIASVTKNELAAGRADGALIALQGEIGRLQHRAFSLLDEFSHARDACTHAIGLACSTAPARPMTGYGVTVIGGGPAVAGL